MDKKKIGRWMINSLLVLYIGFMLSALGYLAFLGYEIRQSMKEIDKSMAKFKVNKKYEVTEVKSNVTWVKQTSGGFPNLIVPCSSEQANLKVGDQFIFEYSEESVRELFYWFASDDCYLRIKKL